jgi:hypothetical protein
MLFSWERSLRYFEMSVLESGHTLQLEHAQRICKLFLGDGSSEDLRRWALICQAEGVFPCSVQLDALIRRGLWQQALLSLRPGMQFWCAELAEETVTRFMSRGQWYFALLALRRFPKIGRNEEPTQRLWSVECSNGLYVRAVDKIVSNRRQFSPSSPEWSCLGPAQCVAAMFPGRSSWAQAAALCTALSERTSKNSAEVLLELALSKAADSSTWEAVLGCVAARGEFATLRMLRSSFRAAVSARCLSASTSILEVLCCKHGTRAVPATELNQLVSMVAKNSSKERADSESSVKALAKCWQRLSNDNYEAVASWRRR